MNEDLLERLSEIMNTVVNRANELPHFHVYRYGHFVKSSPDGRECKYAKLTWRREPEEREELKEALGFLREQIDDILREL